jgi:hypothetical protein
MIEIKCNNSIVNTLWPSIDIQLWVRILSLVSVDILFDFESLLFSFVWIILLLIYQILIFKQAQICYLVFNINTFAILISLWHCYVISNGKQNIHRCVSYGRNYIGSCCSVCSWIYIVYFCSIYMIINVL